MNSQRIGCVMIAGEGTQVTHLREILSASYTLELANWLKQYPDEENLLRMLRLTGVEILILDFSDTQKALRIVSLVQQNAPNAEILAVCEENVSVLSTLLRAGVRDYITPSATFDEIAETLRSLYEKVAGRPKHQITGGDVISFLSAKPGSGASTIAANTSYAASRIGARRTLLADFDRSAGVQSFLFKLKPERTINDALMNVEDLDAAMWDRLPSKVGNLEILPSDLEGSVPTDSYHVNHLMKFLRRTYDLTCVDLPGNLDAGSVEVLLESRRIYLVCTQELASQHLMLRKIERLRRSGIDKQLRIIVNRFIARNVMTPERIAELSGVPVEMTIENNYELATLAVENGSLIKSDTSLGRSYKRLAEIITDRKIESPRPKKSLFDLISQPFLRSTAESAS